MDLNTLRSFFMACTILNGILLIVISLVLMTAGGWVYRLHERWFPMSRATFTAIIYAFLGVYKIIVIAFNLVPWIVLQWVK